MFTRTRECAVTLLKGSVFESNLDLGIAYSAANYGIEQAKNRVKQCACPNISERNFQRQYLGGLEGMIYNLMNDHPPLDDSCPKQSSSWIKINSHLKSISSCNLVDVSNGGPCLFALGIGSVQIQVALATCPSESDSNRAGFGIAKRVPYFSVNCKGSDCELIGYPCQRDSDCGGNGLTCWDLANGVYTMYESWNHIFSAGGLYNQFETCKSAEQLFDILMKAIMVNHWGQTSLKKYSSIKMCGPKLGPILQLASCLVHQMFAQDVVVVSLIMVILENALVIRVGLVLRVQKK